MLHKGYLDQIGVEFRQKLIGAIVNWPTPNWKTFMGSMGLFEGIFGPFWGYFLVLFQTFVVLMLQRGNLIGVEFCQQVIGAIVNLPTLKRRTLRGSIVHGPFWGCFCAFFLTFLALMLQKGYLDQIGVEFHPKLIHGIVNWHTPSRRTLKESMSLFEGILGLWAQAFNVIPKT